MGCDGRQLNEDQRVALQKFAVRGDRGRASIFVGREVELALIRDRLDLLVERQTDGESAPGSDLTTVIQGAPGAGKSALLEKIAEDWPQGEEGKPTAIRLAASVLKLPTAGLLEIILQQVSGHAGIQRTLARFLRSISVNIAGVAEGAFDIDPSQLTSESLTPIILLFDEMQSPFIEGDTELQSNLAENIRLLHMGEHGAPVFPVYAGLTTGADLLLSTGLSRLSMGSELILSGFSDAEMDELMMRFVDEYLSSARPTSPTLERWGYALCRDSQGWPMHCRNFLIALCEQIREKDWRPEDIDLDVVRMRAQQLRFRYYAQRMQDALGGQEARVSTVLEALRQDGPMPRGEIIGLIAKTYKDHPPGNLEGEVMPDGVRARKAFDAMLHSGIVQKVDEYDYICPIPSLSGHIAAKATLPSSRLHGAVLKAKPEEIDQIMNRCRDETERAQLLQRTDARKRTPLMLAVELGIMPVVEHLVQAESRLPTALRSVEFRDSEGRTARDHAVASGDERIVALLDRIQPAESAHEISG